MAVLFPRYDKPQPSNWGYSAIVYIDDNRIIAEDSTGEIIASGKAGVADHSILNSLLTTSNNIQLGPGTFNISDEILIASRVRLIGSGVGQTIIKLKDNAIGPGHSGGPLGSDYAAGLYIYDSGNVELAHFTFDGNKANQTPDTDEMKYTTLGIYQYRRNIAGEAGPVYLHDLCIHDCWSGNLYFESMSTDGPHCLQAFGNNIEVYNGGYASDPIGAVRGGIELDRAKNVMLSNIHAHHNVRHGINFWTSQECHVKGLTSHDNVDAVFFGCSGEPGVGKDTFNCSVEFTSINDIHGLWGHIASGYKVYNFDVIGKISGSKGNAAYFYVEGSYYNSLLNLDVKSTVGKALRFAPEVAAVLRSLKIIAKVDGATDDALTLYGITQSDIEAYISNVTGAGIYMNNCNHNRIKAKIKTCSTKGIKMDDAASDYNEISATITDCTEQGIYCYRGNHNNIHDCLLYSNGNNGVTSELSIKYAKYNRIHDCIIVPSLGTYSIQEHSQDAGNPDYNFIYENELNAGKTGVLFLSGIHSKASRNIGYITENSGIATITAGNYYVDVTHGLAATPTKLTAPSWQDNINSIVVWVTNVGTKTFRVNFNKTDLVNHSFYWSAEV